MTSGAWRRYFDNVADLHNEAPVAIRDLERFLAAWEDDEAGLALDLEGFAYHLGDLSDRELAAAVGVFRAHRAHFAESGALATAQLLEELLAAIMDEVAERGLSWGAPV
jgi:hypothetical protein